MTSVKETTTERRPRSTYSEKLAERVCQLIAVSTIGLKRMVAADMTLPSESTIYLWVQLYPDFHDKYHAAREAQAEARWAACQVIAEDYQKDVKVLVAASDPQLAAKTKALNEAAKLVIDVQCRMIAWLSPKKASEIVSKPPKRKPFMYKTLDDLIC